MNNNYLWGQFGASIDMLENAIKDCPEVLWSGESDKYTIWYVSYHVLFWMDFYLTPVPEEYKSYKNIGITEHDPEGKLPEKEFTKEELLDYLDYCRKKCKDVLLNLTEEIKEKNYHFYTLELKFLELCFYNLRHLQHHVGQVNLILSMAKGKAPRWVKKTEEK